jgi:hypothetical protein
MYDDPNEMLSDEEVDHWIAAMEIGLQLDAAVDAAIAEMEAQS